MSRSISILVLVLAVGGVAAMMVWKAHVDEERRLREAIAKVEAEMAREIAAREAMIDRLGRDRRRAIVEILSQQPIEGTSPDAPSIATEIRLVELDDAGRELGRRDFTIPGDVLFIDGWTARFPREAVAEGDPLRGSTIVLLRRLYSDRMNPADGHPIDTPGGVPDGYAASEVSRFEQSIWRNFWRLASDRDAAAAQGVRVAQGEAVYKRVAPGETYELLVEAAGGMTLVPAAKPEGLASAEERTP
jgi:hypothetical protein